MLTSNIKNRLKAVKTSSGEFTTTTRLARSAQSFTIWSLSQVIPMEAWKGERGGFCDRWGFIN